MMRLLFDQNLSFRLCESLGLLFPESSHVRLVQLSNADDRAIWNYARVHGFTIVSQDADFADLATWLGAPPKVIWLRCGNRPTGVIERLLRDHADSVADFEASDQACLEIY